MGRKPDITSNLCSDARQGHKLNPAACQGCESPCEYGRDWLLQLGMKPPAETREHDLYPEGTFGLSTTFRDICLRRNKSLRANRN